MPFPPPVILLKCITWDNPDSWRSFVHYATEINIYAIFYPKHWWSWQTGDPVMRPGCDCVWCRGRREMTRAGGEADPVPATDRSEWESGTSRQLGTRNSAQVIRRSVQSLRPRNPLANAQIMCVVFRLVVQNKVFIHNHCALVLDNDQGKSQETV